MNFFAQQDRAKQKTFWLVALLVAAVICLIVMTVLVAAVALYFSQQTGDPALSAAPLPWWQHLQQVFASDVFFYAAGGVLLVVTCGSLYKSLQLGGSGRKVAEALGGRKIEPNTAEPHERKVLNVVEEMAIASGNPVPPVYVIDDTSINAFAAGTDRRNAVIGVTRGCLNLLTRDELQGVIAHEFSHIHFGDMRINLRLVALLHGILIIGLIGSFILRSSMYGGRNRNRSVQLGLGLAFLILGYSGIFFGNIIKAAVSRQREFLADASAVQFTRNPDGIANALKKIGGLSNHALLTSPVATEYSHLYFGQGIKSALGGLTDTHPPLEVRIKKIQPGWDGEFVVPGPATADAEPARSRTAEQPGAQGFASPHSPGAAPASKANTELGDAIAQIGNPTAATIADAQYLIAALPGPLREAAHEPFSARALVYCLLTDRDSERYRQSQVQALSTSADGATFQLFNSLLPQVQALPREQQLPLIELAIPAIKSQSAPQYRAFKENLVMLIRTDQQVSLFEWCLYRIVTANAEETPVAADVKLANAKAAIEVVLSAVCFSGKTKDTASALRAAQQHLSGMSLQPRSGAEISFQQLDKAVARLASLKPLDKPPVLKALAACIQADQLVTPAEAELFRAIADCLDCPVPMITANGGD